MGKRAPSSEILEATAYLCGEIKRLSAWSSNQAARACNVDHHRWNAWESGEGTPTAENFHRLQRVWAGLLGAEHAEREAGGITDKVTARELYGVARKVRSELGRGGEVPAKMFWTGGGKIPGTSTVLSFSTTDISCFTNPARQSLTVLYHQTRDDGATRSTMRPESLREQDWKEIRKAGG
jgi:hypothetical protein